MYLCVKIYFVRKFLYEVGGKFSSIMIELFFIFMFCLKKKKDDDDKSYVKKRMNEWMNEKDCPILFDNIFI